MRPLLNLFVNLKISLLKQLIQLAYCSHLILHIYRKWKSKFITRELYLDIQSTIQDTFLSVSIFKEKNPLVNLYTYQMGTDQLEVYFGDIRTITHSPNCDYLELLERMTASLQTNRVLIDHPDWRKSSRFSISTNDHSSSQSCKGKLTTDDISISQIWSHGQHAAY